MINQNNDSRGVDASIVARIEPRIQQAKQEVVREAIAGVEAKVNLGGSFAKTMGRRR